MDAESFDDFYRSTAQRTLQYALGMCGDLGVAQDLTQEAYVRAWLSWRKLSGYDDAEAWLRRVVTNLVTDRWRMLAARRRAIARLLTAETVAPPSDDGLILAAALRKLPVPQRRALVLHYLMDLSLIAVAEETGASVGTVKSWLSRGRTALAGLLSAPIGGSDE